MFLPVEDLPDFSLRPSYLEPSSFPQISLGCPLLFLLVFVFPQTYRDNLVLLPHRSRREGKRRNSSRNILFCRFFYRSLPPFLGQKSVPDILYIAWATQFVRLSPMIFVAYQGSINNAEIFHDIFGRRRSPDVTAFFLGRNPLRSSTGTQNSERERRYIIVVVTSHHNWGQSALLLASRDVTRQKKIKKKSEKYLAFRHTCLWDP